MTEPAAAIRALTERAADFTLSERPSGADVPIMEREIAFVERDDAVGTDAERYVAVVTTERAAVADGTSTEQAAVTDGTLTVRGVAATTEQVAVADGALMEGADAAGTDAERDVAAVVRTERAAVAPMSDQHLSWNHLLLRCRRD